jgi:hypothetical protein
MPDIEVIVRKAEGVAGAAQTRADQTGERNANKREKGKKNKEQEAVNAAIIQVGKQVISRGISQYGNLTGSYSTQRNIDAVLTIGADIGTIAVGGPAGAVLVAAKYAIELATSFVNQEIAIREHDFQLRRLGDISIKGSRY